MLNIPSSSITVIKPPFDEDLSKDNFKTASEYCLATAIEKSKSLSNDMIINHLQVRNNKKNTENLGRIPVSFITSRRA